MASGRYAYLVQDKAGHKLMMTREQRDGAQAKGLLVDSKRILVPATWCRGF